MSQNEYSTDLDSFLDNVLSPTEAFARLCVDSCKNLFIPNTPKGGFEDFGVVTGALVSLSRKQLQEFAEKLQSQVGKIEVSQPVYSVVPDKVCQVMLKPSGTETPEKTGKTPEPDNTTQRAMVLQFLKENPDFLNK